MTFFNKSIPEEVPRWCFKDNCLLQTPHFWGDWCMNHSDDIFIVWFYSLTLIHLAMFVEWCEGTVKVPYQLDFLALSSLIAWRFTKSVLFNMSLSGKKNIPYWNIWASLCVFWNSNFRLVSALILFLLISLFLAPFDLPFIKQTKPQNYFFTTPSRYIYRYSQAHAAQECDEDIRNSRKHQLCIQLGTELCIGKYSFISKFRAQVGGFRVKDVFYSIIFKCTFHALSK